MRLAGRCRLARNGCWAATRRWMAASEGGDDRNGSLGSSVARQRSRLSPPGSDAAARSASSSPAPVPGRRGTTRWAARNLVAAHLDGARPAGMTVVAIPIGPGMARTISSSTRSAKAHSRADIHTALSASRSALHPDADGGIGFVAQRPPGKLLLTTNARSFMELTSASTRSSTSARSSIALEAALSFDLDPNDVMNGGAKVQLRYLATSGQPYGFRVVGGRQAVSRRATFAHRP